MKIYAISDLHLSSACDKPMDIFGTSWNGYWDSIVEDWNAKVCQEDVVLICGDISWGMTLEEALPDLNAVAALKGRKIIVRGNHDYWWSTISKVRASLGGDFYAVQNDAVKLGRYIFCGSRLWGFGRDEESLRLSARELTRLELSLKAADALREEGDVVTVLCHYPPFDAAFADSDYTRLFESYRVKNVVYGHLHGREARVRRYLEKGGVRYFLSSCDLVDNRLVFIDGD